jgi:hypothetical protein
LPRVRRSAAAAAEAGAAAKRVRPLAAPFRGGRRGIHAEKTASLYYPGWALPADAHVPAFKFRAAILSDQINALEHDNRIDGSVYSRLKRIVNTPANFVHEIPNLLCQVVVHEWTVRG